jgi:hypothetical protein
MNRVVKLNPSSNNWKTYINYEKYFGNVDSLRKVYKRALEYCKDDKDYFSENWILWEKIFGTVKDIEYALNYSKTRKDQAKIRKPLKLSKKRISKGQINEVEAEEEIGSEEEGNRRKNKKSGIFFEYFFPQTISRRHFSKIRLLNILLML